jgi:hypothetical protein
MAIVYIPTVKTTVGGVAHITETNERTDSFTFTSVGTDGAYLARTFDSSNNVTDEFKDQKTTILFYNSGASDLTVDILPGDSYAAHNKKTITVEDGTYAAVQIDSAYFKDVNGTDKIGAVHIDPSASVGVALIEFR